MQPLQDTGQRHAQTRGPLKSMPNLWPMGTLEDGVSPGMPWRLWGNLHFSPEPQPNPTRVVPMMRPRFQPPGPCPKHELRTQGRWGSGWKKDFFYSRHWSCFLSLNFLLWPNSRLRTHSQGVSGVLLSPKMSPPLLCQFGKSYLIHSFLIMSQCPMALLGRGLLSKLGVLMTIPLSIQSLYSACRWHLDGPCPSP